MSYKDDVCAVFDRLQQVSWSVFFENDFWHTANTLDTCVDFIVEGSSFWGDLPDRRKLVQGMIVQSYQWFLRVYNDQNGPNKRSPVVWWDDYGWWGIAFTKIHRNFAEIFAGANNPQITRDDCRDVARQCWTVLYSYSKYVNDSVKPPLKGPVDGGCWNHPPEDSGVQNSVTNGLFLVLSARLFESTGERGFLQATAEQYLWFRSWFVNYLQKQAECPLPGKQQGLFRCLDPGRDGHKLVVVYERPIDPKNPKYNQGNPPFSDGQLWTGDQGLFLGGLAEVLLNQTTKARLRELPIIKAQDPTFPSNAVAMAMSVGLGVMWLFDTASVLHEAPLNGQFGTDYAADYATGKGVLMRYLVEGLASVGLPYANTYVTPCAKAILHGKAADNQLSFQWSKRTDSKIGTNESQVTTSSEKFAPTVQSAGLDGLNAAIEFKP